MKSNSIAVKSKKATLLIPDWGRVLGDLEVSGKNKEFTKSLSVIRTYDGIVELLVPPHAYALATDSAINEVTYALRKRFGGAYCVEFMDYETAQDV